VKGDPGGVGGGRLEAARIFKTPVFLFSRRSRVCSYLEREEEGDGEGEERREGE